MLPEKRTRTKTKVTEIEEIFRRVANINMQINAKTEEIGYWRLLSVKTGEILSAVKTGKSNKRKSRTEDCVCKIAGIEESLKKDMDELIKLKERVTEIIGKIDVPEYKSLLTHRYLCDKTWAEVAASMGYSYVHVVNRIRPRVFERIEEMGIRGSGDGD